MTQTTVPKHRVARAIDCCRVHSRYACPTCAQSSSLDRVFERRLQDLGNRRFAYDLVLRYSQHYCRRCNRYFSVDMTDVCPQSSLYTNEVIAQAVHSVLVEHLSYREASSHLRRCFHVFAPFGTIHNWVQRYRVERGKLFEVARKRADHAVEWVRQDALEPAGADLTQKDVERFRSTAERLQEYKEQIRSELYLLREPVLPDGKPAFTRREFTAWFRIILHVESGEPLNAQTWEDWYNRERGSWRPYLEYEKPASDGALD